MRVWMSLLVVILVVGDAYGQAPGSQDPAPTPTTASTAEPTTPPPAVAPQPPPKKPDRHLVCFAGRPFKCASVFLLELGARGDGSRSIASANIGLLIHDGLDAYGGIIGVAGISDAKADASPWLAGRYRRYFGRWGFAGDVSVGYAGGPALEVAIGWADVVALTAGVNRYELEDGSHDVFVGAGIRVGSVTIGGLFYLAAHMFAGAR